MLFRLDIVMHHEAHSFRPRLSSASQVTAVAMSRATALAVALNWVGHGGLSRPPDDDACWLLEGFDELDLQLIGGDDLAGGQDGLLGHGDLASFRELAGSPGPVGVDAPAGPLMC